MSMHVRVYEGELFKGENWKILDSEIGDDLAGPEATRKELWGSTIIQSFGLKLLPTLIDTDLYVENNQLDDLLNEVNIVRNNVQQIALQTLYYEYSLLQITGNILKAINRAKEIGGGVIIE